MGELVMNFLGGLVVGVVLLGLLAIAYRLAYRAVERKYGE